ncbi:MAG: hypothetical protein A2580_15865 [Hydrogenophilales bacterium RIFOXYD1_FULL_62_11]|nr:MAG: hypothetical protein A2580_15865 [Hydrogenophilales bacterium RIFOXYD1_FULL_62_11]
MTSLVETARIDAHSRRASRRTPTQDFARNHLGLTMRKAHADLGYWHGQQQTSIGGARLSRGPEIITTA